MKHNMFSQKKVKPKLKQKLRYLFMLQTDQMMWVHKDIASRKLFKRINTILMLSVFLLFCVGVALFAIFGLKYSVDIELDPFYLENGNFNVGIVIGLIIFILAFIIGTLLAIIIPILFKESQAKYVRTDEWAKSAKKFKNEKYLKKLNLKSLIWAKKMLYIDKPTFVLYRHLLLKKK